MLNTPRSPVLFIKAAGEDLEEPPLITIYVFSSWWLVLAAMESSSRSALSPLHKFLIKLIKQLSLETQCEPMECSSSLISNVQDWLIFLEKKEFNRVALITFERLFVCNFKIIRETTKSNATSNLSCPQVAHSDNSKTATEVRTCEWNESRDEWFTTTDANCKLIGVDLTAQLKTC